MDKNKFPLYSTGNYIQHHVINYNGKENEKKTVIESLCCTPETNTKLYTFNKINSRKKLIHLL